MELRSSIVGDGESSILASMIYRFRKHLHVDCWGHHCRLNQIASLIIMIIRMIIDLLTTLTPKKFPEHDIVHA